MDTEGIKTELLLDDEPETTAKVAGLRYVDCEGPGVRRKRWGRGFTYLDEEGEHITDPDVRKRFEELAIPPAWTEVWICPDDRGHIQVTGRDSKGRKQYIYHPRWNEIRNRRKFDRMVLFGEALPNLRKQIDSDLRKHGTPRRRVLAAVVRLLQETLIRVGNPEYERNNNSFGLTTLHDDHLELTGSRVHFEFRGKSGKMQEVDVRDPRAARLVSKLQELPGQELFQYLDDQGERHSIGSADVNEYIHEAAGHGFSAKDFRTWGGTVHAVRVAAELEASPGGQDVEKEVRRVYEAVADLLGNTPAISRDYYVHPAVIDAYREGKIADYWNSGSAEHEQLEEANDTWLSRAEHVTWYLLREAVAKQGA